MSDIQPAATDLVQRIADAAIPDADESDTTTEAKVLEDAFKQTQAQRLADDLDRFVTFLREHPDASVPNIPVLFESYFYDKDAFVKAVGLIGAFEKEAGQYMYRCVKKFGTIVYSIRSSRDLVCTRREVGTKHIPGRTVPEHYEPAENQPIYEYDCPESLLGKGTDE